MEKKSKTTFSYPRMNFNNPCKQIQTGTKTMWAGFLPTCVPCRTQTIRGVSSYSPGMKYQTSKNPSTCSNAARIKIASLFWDQQLTGPGN